MAYVRNSLTGKVFVETPYNKDLPNMEPCSGPEAEIKAVPTPPLDRNEGRVMFNQKTGVRVMYNVALLSNPDMRFLDEYAPKPEAKGDDLEPEPEMASDPVEIDPDLKAMIHEAGVLEGANIKTIRDIRKKLGLEGIFQEGKDALIARLREAV